MRKETREKMKEEAFYIVKEINEMLDELRMIIEIIGDEKHEKCLFDMANGLDHIEMFLK